MSPKLVFRTRLLPKLTRHVSKAIVSRQNERFVRDFLQNSFVKFPRRALRARLRHTSSLQSDTKLPPKVKREAPSEHMHKAALPSSFAISDPPSTRQSKCHSDIHLHHNSQPHDSLRLPQKLARPHLKHAQSTVPATNCDLRHTSQPHDSLHLAQKLHFHNSKLAQRTAPATKSNNSNIISS